MKEQITWLAVRWNGWWSGLEEWAQRPLQSRRERGLSQSTETALLVAGAVLVASIIFVAVRALITTKMGEATGGAAGIS